MKVALLSLRWCQFGGWPSHNHHIIEALRSVDVTCDAFSLESPTGAHDWVKRIKPEGLTKLSKDYDLVHITTVSSKIEDLLPTLCDDIPSVLVNINDPTELTPPVLDLLKYHPDLLVTYIRTSVMDCKATQFVKMGKFLPLPYKRESNGAITGKRIISTSRVDFDKNTHIILEADCGIEIWSGSINRIYDYHKLRTIIPNGVKAYPFYKGAFEKPADVYRGACTLVDLSVIKGDGGGAQYTFLEAMDYGLTLVCHKGWITKTHDELKPNDHYIPVDTADELRSVVNEIKSRKQIDNRKRYATILGNHDHQTVGKMFKDTYAKWLGGDRTSMLIKRGLGKW